MLMNKRSGSEVLDEHVPAQSSIGHLIHQRLRSAGQFLLLCLDVSRQRQQLLSLDERSRTDIGISRIEVLREANRSFWDIPQQITRRG